MCPFFTTLIIFNIKFLDEHFHFHTKKIETKIPTTTMDSQTAKILSAKILSYSERKFENFVTQISSPLAVHPCCWDFYLIILGALQETKGFNKLNAVLRIIDCERRASYYFVVESPIFDIS